ncbi:ABC transporter permease subunit [Paenibacillus sp. LMG 31460]|uniref:ABC transporter permease subunit n=1 Tax=Paenibacillus germinis TaxID=2654979 RepID=A0ABX1Z4V1_9BACL|nr:ABC transporter permease subunit [Paenibacillus germinis]NOU88410.1 ABC transporter permease subunit [Paenibacillus germinis]
MKALRTFRKNYELFLLTVPGMLFLFVFCYIPLYGLVLPFKDYRYDLGFWKSPWVGFKNFHFLFSSEDALRITRNTVLLNALFIVVLLVLSIMFALMLYEMSRKFIKLYQTIMFFPFFLSWVVVSYVFLAFLDMEHGFINMLLQKMHISPVLWYNEPSYWPSLLVSANTWKNIGYFTIIYYTGLLGIDSELFDAADIDGASKLQKIKNISIPMLKPMITMLLLLQIGKIFYGNFDLFYNLTRDSSLLYSTTDVIDTYVYRSLKGVGDFGMSSAASAYQSFVGFILVIVSNWIIKKYDRENALF